MEGMAQHLLKQLPFDQSPTFYFSLFCFVIALFVFNLTRRQSKLNLPPSPPKFPFIGNLHQLGTLPHHSFRALSRKYGPLMLLQLGQTPTLVVSSARFAKEIMKTHDIVFADRPQTTSAKILLYQCKDVGFARFGEEWRQRKKICVIELLSAKRVRSFQFVREEEAADLVNKIRKACAENNGSPVNLTEMIIATANSIVTRCIFGQKYETADGKSSFGHLARKVMIHLRAFSFGDFYPSLGWLDYVTGLIPKMNATFRELDTLFDEVVAQHKAAKTNEDYGKSEKKDFVDILLQLQEDEILDIEFTHDNLKAIIVDMFVGGTDTTSASLEWAFAELMRNPKIMKKAQEEVRRVVGNKSKVDENDVRQMKYLECVLKETLRLRTPVPLLVPRETRSCVTIGGYDIPPNINVFVNAWAIHRDPEIWEKPEEFVPERFESNEIDFESQDFQLLPFGSGRRGCPGKVFGLASVEFVLANLLYWFDWKLPGTYKSPQDVDMSETYGLTVNKKKPIYVQPIPYSVGPQL